MSDFTRTEIETPETKKVPYFRIFKLFIWIFIILAWTWYFSYLSFQDEIINNETKIIQIEPWDTFWKLSEKFEKLDSFWFKYHLSKNTPEYDLQIWDYKVEWNIKVDELLNSFKYPIIEEEKITLLEGWNIFDIDEYLSKKGLITEWEYISYANNTDKIKKLTEFFPFLKWLKTLEWFLYPDTYKIDKLNFKINKFVIVQLENFEKKIYNTLLSPPPSGTPLKNKGRKDISNEEIENLIILASIVEKEEKIDSNKSTVAWILKKRLDEWWMIWADITVCYPYKLTSEECKMVVTKYLYEENDYNTRTKYGLPITPIWNPSFTTIEATFNPKNTPYYFYLHDKTGQIHYWRTNEEHVNNKNKYLY